MALLREVSYKKIIMGDSVKDVHMWSQKYNVSNYNC
jgi:hypothetical protein